MIIFDASYLIAVLYPSSPPAKDRANNPVSQLLSQSRKPKDVLLSIRMMLILRSSRAA